MSADDEFYVGYLKQAPTRLAGTTRRRVALWLVGALAAAATLAITQRQFGDGRWSPEEQQFEGWLEAGAVPRLTVLRAGQNGPASFLTHSLVLPFKHGARSETEPFDGAWVTLAGTLVARDGVRMIEVAPGSIRTNGVPAGPRSDAPVPLGVHTFRGEIVDSKCYLGVMNPGHLKTHKQCAILCIRGGIPPVLLVRDTSGKATCLHLVDAGGGAVNDQVLPFVAEPVEITGEVERQGDLLLLKSDPATFRRLE